RAFVANLLTAHCGRTPGSVRRLKSTFTRPLVAALRACALGGGMLGACGLAGCAQTADPNANTAGSVSAPGGTTFPAGSVGASGTSSPSSVGAPGGNSSATNTSSGPNAGQTTPAGSTSSPTNTTSGPTTTTPQTGASQSSS